MRSVRPTVARRAKNPRLVAVRLKTVLQDCKRLSGNQPNVMRENLKELNSIEDLDTALAESKERPVLLFKHSLTCPISARAMREFEAFLDQAPPRVGYKLIIVQTAREVSNEAAARLGLRHESPQAVIVRRGREVWSTSHYDITAERLREAVRSFKE